LTGFWLYGPGDNTHILGEGGAFLTDDRRNNMTIFGGLASGGLSNVTLDYNATVLNWSITQLSFGVAPTPRANVSYVSDQGRDLGVVFGGLTDLPTQRVAKDTWVYWFSNRSWQNVSIGPSPSARENAAMAIDAGAGVALLEGGVDPSFHTGGGTGAVLWNDTWMLNMTTLHWTRLSILHAPPPMFGSSMIFDNVSQRFLLFGGCGQACTASLWSYRLGDPAWNPVNATGARITPRASAAFAWDPIQSDATLFGGFQPGANGPRVFSDTDVFDPTALRWTSLGTAGTITPVYDPTYASPHEKNCAGMWVWSGSPSLNGPPSNTWLLQSTNPPWPNCYDVPTGNGTGPPPPPCPNATTQLHVSVIDRGTGAGVPGASLVFAGPCAPSTQVTGSGGGVQFGASPGIGWNITVSRVGYYTRLVHYSAPAAPSANLTIALVDLPMATVDCYGETDTGVVPLPNVTVVLDQSVVLGACDAHGHLGPLQLPFAGGWLTFSGSLPGYSGANVTLLTPPNAGFEANLTLKAAGPLHLHVVRVSDGSPVVGAAGLLTAIDRFSTSPLRFTTDRGGWFNVTVGGANFTVNLSAPGLAFTRYGPLFHPWMVTTNVTIRMDLPGGDNLTVVLLDRSTGAAIVGGTVGVAPHSSATTDSNGSATFRNLGPPGPAEVVGSAPGFESASRLVVLTPTGTLPTMVFHLNRTPDCTFPDACALSANATGAPAFHLLPGTGWAFDLLVASPAVLLAAAAAGILLRRAWPMPPRTVDPSGPVRRDPVR
jgi:hypothetical protein